MVEFGYHGEWYTLLIIDIIDWNDSEKFVYSTFQIQNRYIQFHTKIIFISRFCGLSTDFEFKI